MIYNTRKDTSPKLRFATMREYLNEFLNLVYCVREVRLVQHNKNIRLGPSIFSVTPKIHSSVVVTCYQLFCEPAVRLP